VSDDDATHTTHTADTTASARRNLAIAQTALLSALVAGTPVPEGFDRARIAVQSRALAAKRADVVARVAPELPAILGDGYRPAFLAYATRHPMPAAGYRRDALSFAESQLSTVALPAAVRTALNSWWEERSGPAPLHRFRLKERTAHVFIRMGGGLRSIAPQSFTNPR
jgi:hypothetical protein